MSKLSQIERALQALDGGTFQQLCDAYLHKRGYEGLNPLGRLIGTDKVAKGTPDTWIRQTTGKLVFAEHTNTRRDETKNKILSDLAKCVDESRAGVPVSHIQEIIFCHTAVLGPDEEDAVLQAAETHGVVVTIIGIGPLAHDLYQKYRGLARDFLAISPDSGQLVDPDEFVRLYGNHRLATPLDTPFRFREAEIEDVLCRLAEKDLVILSGRPGVGKSRLALEAIRRFREMCPEYTAICIYNRGADIFEDLRIHLGAPGSYVVFVDDANRLSGFDQVLQLVRDRHEHVVVKVIATVRDYALPAVREAVHRYAHPSEIEVLPFADEQIKKLVWQNTAIGNPLFLERVTTIAHGNPRLALMAAEVARRENSIASIADVSVLYDDYFQSVRSDLAGLGDRNLLRVGAIVALLRVVDRSEPQWMEMISAGFGINGNVFWREATRLHEMELLDMYENEVVRISDQVLATYLLYLGFFKDRGALDVSVVLDRVLPKMPRGVEDAFVSVFSAFGTETLSAQIRPHVRQALERAQARGDENHVLQLLDVFWFVVPTEALLAVRERVGRFEPDPRVNLAFDPRKASGPGKAPLILSVLEKFRYSDERHIALDLLLEYAGRVPSDVPHVLALLIGQYGIRHVSVAEGFQVERAVVDALSRRIASTGDLLFTRMFLAIAGEFLQTTFRTTELGSGHTAVSRKFRLQPDTEVEQLRARIWSQLFSIARGPLRADALAVLRIYSMPGRGHSVREILATDADHILPFIEAELDASNFSDCLLVQEYLRLLGSRGVSFNSATASRFRSETYRLYRLICRDWRERMELGRDEYDATQRTRLSKYFARADANDYNTAFGHAAAILAALPDDRDGVEVRFGIERVFLLLADRDSALFVRVVRQYLETGNTLGLWAGAVIGRLLEHCGPHGAHAVLANPEYLHKRSWLLGLHTLLGAEDLTPSGLRELYALYWDANASDLPYDLGFLVKYEALDPEVVSSVVRILIVRAASEPRCAVSLRTLFSRDTAAPELRLRLSGSGDLLKRAYLALQLVRQHDDHDGSGFNLLLDLDPGFGREYVEWVFSHVARRDPFPEGPDPDHDQRKYDFLWQRHDHARVMEEIVRHTYALERNLFMWDSYVSVFFATRQHELEGRNEPPDSSIQERQDRLLEGLLERNACDAQFSAWLFDVICNFVPERRVRLLRAFLAHNTSLADFEMLKLERDGWMAIGSLVPVYQRRVEALEGFLPLLNSIDLLRHRQVVEGRIDVYRKMIAAEKKRDFMER